MTRKKRIPDAPFLHDVHEFEAQCTQASAAVLVTLKALAEKHKQMRVWDHLSARVRKVVAMSKCIWGRAAPSMNALAESRWELGAEALWDTLGDALFSPDFVRLLAHFAHHADATTWPDAHQALVAAADARRANKSRRERISVTRAWVPSDVKDAMMALGVPLPAAAAPKTKAKATARTSAPPPSQSPSPPPFQSLLSRKREAPAFPSRLAPIAEEASPRIIEDASPTNSRLTPIPEKAPPDAAEDPSPTASRLTPIREEASSGTAGHPSPEIEQARKSELANLSDFDQDFDEDFDFLSAPSPSHSPLPSLSPTPSPPPVPTPHFPTPLHSNPRKRRPDDANPPCSPQRSPKRVCARADMPNNDTVVVATGQQTEQEERLYMALQQLQEDQWLGHAAIFETLALLTPPSMHLEETTLDDELPAEQLQRWATTARKPLGPDVGQVLCPLHRSRRRHWLLLHFHLADHRVTLHDSMKLNAAAYVSELAASKALVQRFGQDWDAGGWKFELSLTTPQQDGFNDCGIFTIISCLQYIGRVRPIDQVDGSLWRTAFRCLLRNAASTPEEADTLVQGPPASPRQADPIPRHETLTRRCRLVHDCFLVFSCILFNLRSWPKSLQQEREVLAARLAARRQQLENARQVSQQGSMDNDGDIEALVRANVERLEREVARTDARLVGASRAATHVEATCDAVNSLRLRLQAAAQDANALLDAAMASLDREKSRISDYVKIARG